MKVNSNTQGIQGQSMGKTIGSKNKTSESISINAVSKISSVVYDLKQQDDIDDDSDYRN